jgi:hypothetical protein
MDLTSVVWWRDLTSGETLDNKIRVAPDANDWPRSPQDRPGSLGPMQHPKKGLARAYSRSDARVADPEVAAARVATAVQS